MGTGVSAFAASATLGINVLIAANDQSSAVTENNAESGRIFAIKALGIE